MFNMSKSDWVSTSPAGEIRGPIFIPQGKVISGIEVREQAGFGIIDLRLSYRDYNSGDAGETGWLTNNENANWVRQDDVSEQEIVIGIRTKEQAGHGLIDMQLVYKNVRDGMKSYGKWLTGNKEQAIENEVTISEGYVTGIEGKEQAGFGIVNLRVVNNE